MFRHKRAFLDNRRVELKGEAYFQVKKDPAHPFRVETGPTTTTVLGTAFDIREMKEEQAVEIRVTEGKVSFSAENSKQLILSQGMAARYAGLSNRLDAIPFGSLNHVLWAKNKLEFNDSPVQQVLDDLGHYFGIKIHHTLPVKYCSFTGSFDHPTEEEVIDRLQKILDLTIQKEQGEWIVNGGICQ